MTVAHATYSCHAATRHAAVHASAARPVSVSEREWASSAPCQRTGRTRKSVKSNLNFDVAVHSYSLFAYVLLPGSLPLPLSPPLQSPPSVRPPDGPPSQNLLFPLSSLSSYSFRPLKDAPTDAGHKVAICVFFLLSQGTTAHF